MRRTALVSLVAAGALLGAAAPVAAQPPSADAETNAATTAEPTATDPRDAARDAVGRGRAAARKGDYTEALGHFERALALAPAPKLHFNIAVCHHRLLGRHGGDAEPYERHRAAAIAAYNAYLEAAPEAPDRSEVAALVTALGGTPWTPSAQPWTIELVEPDDVPDPPPFDGWEDPPAPDDPEDDPPDLPCIDDPPGPPVAVPLPPPSYRGAIGAFVPIGWIAPVALGRSDELVAAPAIGLGLRGYGFVGPRRRLVVGAEAALSAQATSPQKRHRYSHGQFALYLGYRHPLGSAGRVELGVDGVLGVASQALVFRGSPRLRCSEGPEASRRGGLGSQVRFVASMRLGPKRRHVIAARVGPGLAAFGSGSLAAEGTDGMDCSGEPTAFERFSLPGGAALGVGFDLGYALRL